MFEIAVTDRKLSVTKFSVRPINDTDITTSKYWSFQLITCYSKLTQVQTEFFFHRNWKNKRCKLLIRCPMLLWWVPRQTCISPDDFAELGQNQRDSVWNVITFFVESLSWKIILACPVNVLDFLYGTLLW